MSRLIKFLFVIERAANFALTVDTDRSPRSAASDLCISCLKSFLMGSYASVGTLFSFDAECLQQ